MAEKQDIPMNQFQIVTDADYVYVEKGNSQGKITAEDLMEQMGLFSQNVLQFRLEGSLNYLSTAV